MKDIDFDELDRAVSSLMSTPAEPEKQTPAATTTTPASSPVSDAATPITVTNNSTPPAPAPSTAPALAQKRSGRFMDMVPNSRPDTSIKAPSRDGMAVTPMLTTTPAAEKPVETPVTPQESSIQAPEPDPTPSDASDKTDWPGPISVPSSSDPATSESSVTVPSEPLGSPFLTDAKVEKRPLNAEPLDTVKDDSFEQPDPITVANDDAADEPPDTPIPEELKSELISIESNELAGKQDETHGNDTPMGGSGTPAVEEPMAEKRLDENSSGPTGPTSIVQQYKEQPSTEDQSHAAIYDSSHFPEPLAHPAKKSSGWLWVLWVVLLLAVGAGGAFALYSLGVIS